MPAHQAEQANQNQVDRDHVVQYSRNQQEGSLIYMGKLLDR